MTTEEEYHIVERWKRACGEKHSVTRRDLTFVKAALCVAKSKAVFDARSFEELSLKLATMGF